MNFGDLKAELFARGTDYLDEDTDGIARAERWLNQAYREILNIQAWPFLQATAVGTGQTDRVSIADLRKIRYVLNRDNLDGGPLRYISEDDLVQLTSDLETTGTPVFYYIQRTDPLIPVVRTYPVGGTIEVHYITRVAAMTDDLDEPLFRDEYHDLIVDRAMMKAYKDSDNFENAAALKAEFDAGVAAMTEDYQLDSREVQFIDVDPYDG